MTLLMSVTPATPLGQLLNLCLATKADLGEDKAARKLADRFLEDPTKIAYWSMDVIGDDANYTPEEWAAFGLMKLDNPDAFIAQLKSELEGLDLG
ncbi:MAG: hypothetical protein AAGG51_04265 [Cyanobacteria bacterium P01_G01_bin.54]